MKKLLLIIALLPLLFLSACRVNDVSNCDHCHMDKRTANQLIGEVDMQICDECYYAYLQGIWGDEYEK